MSSKVMTGSPEDSIEETMGLMTDKRIPPLPILENGKLISELIIDGKTSFPLDGTELSRFPNYLIRQAE